MRGCSTKRTPRGDVARVVAGEVIGLQEQEDPAAGLVADVLPLLVRPSLGQQQPAARRAAEPHDDPAFAAADRRVLHELEAQYAAEDEIASS